MLGCCLLQRAYRNFFTLSQQLDTVSIRFALAPLGLVRTKFLRTARPQPVDELTGQHRSDFSRKICGFIRKKFYFKVKRISVAVQILLLQSATASQPDLLGKKALKI